jgi:hypothetical protein
LAAANSFRNQQLLFGRTYDRLLMPKVQSDAFKGDYDKPCMARYPRDVEQGNHSLMLYAK